MSYYANSDERTGLITGLRELAEFLDQNPQIPAPRHADLLVFPPAGSDAEMFAEIDVIADLIAVTANDSDSPAGPLQRGSRLRPSAVPRRRHPEQRPPRQD
jgi:hypothetical protein